MRRVYVAACAGSLMILLAGCSDTPAPPADTSAADQKLIRDGESAWSDDMATKDVDKIMRHYADDASLLVSGMPIMKGKDAIRAGMKGLLDDMNFSLKFTPSVVETAKSGDLAFSQGSYTMTSTNPKTRKAETEVGKYVTVYKKQADGSWKAVEDIDNADGPAVSAGGKPAAASKSAASKGAAKKRRKK